MWGLNDVLTHSIAYGMGEEEERTKAEREKKASSNWHTGTPTEEGDYYIAFRNFIGADVEYGWASWDGKGWDINFLGWNFSNEILAWQKITPYEEKENGQ